jgi:hypothetical protein
MAYYASLHFKLMFVCVPSINPQPDFASASDLQSSITHMTMQENNLLGFPIFWLRNTHFVHACLKMSSIADHYV